MQPNVAIPYFQWLQHATCFLFSPHSLPFVNLLLQIQNNVQPKNLQVNLMAWRKCLKLDHALETASFSCPCPSPAHVSLPVIGSGLLYNRDTEPTVTYISTAEFFYIESTFINAHGDLVKELASRNV